MKYKTFFLIDDGNNDGLFQLKVGGDKSKLINNDNAKRKVRVVSNTSSNNGVEDYIYNDNIGIKNCITIGTRGNDYFSCYQDDYAVTIVRTLLLYTKKIELTQYIAFYICALLRINKYKCAYGRVLSGERIALEKISLPIDNNENPDWQYIEENGKIAYNKIYNSVNKNPLIKTKLQLKTENWKAFKMSELFEVELGNPIHGEQLTDGDIPYVTRTAANNGIECFGYGDKINDKNAITIGAEGIVAFYQRQDFITGNKINIIRHSNLNKYNAMFLCTVLNYTNIGRFSYGRAIVQKRLKNISIKLPTTLQGEPDWEFMENYIKSLPYSSSL